MVSEVVWEPSSSCRMLCRWSSCSGQVDRKEDTIRAIVEAANYPISIIMVFLSTSHRPQPHQISLRLTMMFLFVFCHFFCQIGVGDGPWDTMEEFDDEIPQRRFDNVPAVDSTPRRMPLNLLLFYVCQFQFCCLTPLLSAQASNSAPHPELEFARLAMQEVPHQYQAIKRLGLL